MNNISQSELLAIDMWKGQIVKGGCYTQYGLVIATDHDGYSDTAVLQPLTPDASRSKPYKDSQRGLYSPTREEERRVRQIFAPQIEISLRGETPPVIPLSIFDLLHNTGDIPQHLLDKIEYGPVSLETALQEEFTYDTRNRQDILTEAQIQAQMFLKGREHLNFLARLAEYDALFNIKLVGLSISNEFKIPSDGIVVLSSESYIKHRTATAVAEGLAYKLKTL